MKELKNQEMVKIKGGASISISSVLNAISKIATTVFSIGQAIGSAIRRGSSGNICGY